MDAEDTIDWQAVKRGDNAIPQLQKLERLVRKGAVVSVTGNVRVHQYEDGKEVVGEDITQNFDGAFTVSLRGFTEVRVDVGTVNLVVPMIGGVRLDGTTRDGGVSPDGAPLLSIKDGGDKESRGSWVCVRVKALGESGKGFDPEDVEALTIAHLKTLAQGIAEGPGYPEEGELVGYRPLAHIQWDDLAKRPIRVRQIRFFDQEYQFIKPKGSRGRHEFSPAP